MASLYSWSTFPVIGYRSTHPTADSPGFPREPPSVKRCSVPPMDAGAEDALLLFSASSSASRTTSAMKWSRPAARGKSFARRSVRFKGRRNIEYRHTIIAMPLSTGPHIELPSRYLFLIPVVVLVLCEITKLSVASVRQGRFAYEAFFHAGGFPSSHSAFVTSLLIVVGRMSGIESVEFAIAVVFASIVWYDAFHARRELGLQAEILNRLQKWKHFTTQLGHSFKEVVGGIAFGALVTMIGIWMT